MAEIASFGVNVDENTKLAQNAQDTANDANKKNSANSQQIANINDPNYLTPFEKPQLEIQMDNFATVYATDKDIAEAEGIDFTAYDAAYQAYLAYMKPLTADISTYSPIVRTTFNSLVVAVQNAQKAFNAATQAKYDQDMDKAKADIANNQSSYAAMQQAVADMKSNANSVADTANAAISSAGFTSNAASIASEAASQAINNAASAAEQAGTALSNANVAMSSAASALGAVNNLNGGGRNYLLNSETMTITPTGAADYDYRMYLSDDFWTNPDRLKANNIKVSFSMHAQNALAASFSSSVYFGAEPWPAKAITYPAGTTDSQKYELTYSITDPAYTTNNLFIRFQTKDTPSFPFIVDHASLTIGSFFVDWSLNPEDVQTQFTNINGQLESKVSQTTYDSLSGTVSENSTLVKQNKNELVSKADSSTVNTLTQRVTTAENTLTQTATKTELDQTKTDVDNINKTVQTNTSDITAQAGKIDGLLSTTSTLGGQYTTLSGQFDLSSKQWTTSFSTVTDDLSNVGAPNLVSATGWTTGADGSGDPVPTTTHSFYTGSHPLYVIHNSSTTENYAYSQRFSLKPNTAYVLSFLGFEDVHVTSTSIFMLARKAGETDSYTQVYEPVKGVVLSASGTQYVKNYSFSTGTDINSGYIRIDNNGSKDGITGGLYFTEVQFEEGSVSTPYRLPETDLATVTALTQVKQTADGAETLAKDNHGDITDLQATAKGIQTTVENKADATKVTELSNLFDVTVKSLGSPNLVSENDWSSPAIVSTHPFYTGAHKLYSLTNLSSAENLTASQDFSVKANTTYTVSLLAFASQNVVSTDIWLLGRPEGSNDDYAAPQLIVGGIKLSNSATQYVTATFTTGNVVNAKLRIDNNGSSDGTSSAVYFTEVQLEEGKIATPYRISENQVQTQFSQFSDDINLRVKKGDVANQFNIDAGGALLQTVGGNTKIVLSAPNIIFDTVNPVQIPSVNIEGTLTGKTIETGTITATTKITGSEIEAPLIHSPDNSFKLDGNTGDIVGPSIHAADNSWGISSAGKIHGIGVTASLIDISGDGTGPDYDKNTGNEASPDTSQGIYSRYSYSTSSGYDSKSFGRKIFKNGYLSINGDTYLNRAIVDWSADGGGVYSYDQMVQANSLKMRAYNFTGTNSQTDNPSDTEGTLSSRIDITPSTISMGTNWSVSDPNVKISSDGTAVFNKVGSKNIVLHSAHTLEVSDGQDLWFSDSTGKQNFSLHAQKFIQSSLLSLKTDITTIDPHDALNEVVKNDVMSYHYKADDPSEPKSVSVILDDINQIPEYYTSNIFKSADGTGRNDGNIVGYLMLSIKDLNSRLQKLEGAN